MAEGEVFATLIPPGAGRRFGRWPNQPTVKVGPETGARQVCLLETDLPRGGGPPMAHSHDDFEEIFYVLEGEIQFFLGDRWVTAGPGSTVFAPAGAVHAFRNAGERLARQLIIAAPTEVLAMLEELGQAWPDGMVESHERHRSHVVRSVPALRDQE